MNAPVRSSLQREIGLPVWVFQAVVVILVVAKIAHAGIVPPNEDEAYYWLWGQHPELSYFDHAPLVGWMMALQNLLFGWNLLSMRAGNFVTLIGTGTIFWHWAKVLVPDDWQRAFWASLAVYLATPLIFGITSLAYPDVWLIFFGLLSAHFFARCFAGQMDGAPLRVADLYLGAIFLGLAALSKYNAVLLGLAVALAIVLSPRLRPLLRSPHLYLAALASVAVLSPILIWNAMNDFVSLRFQLYERHGSGWLNEINWYEFIRFCILFAIYMSPFLLVPFAVMLVRRSGGGLLSGLHAIGRWGLVVSLVPIFALSLFVSGAPHWAVIGLVVPAAIAIHFFWSRWLVLGHLLFGTLLGVGVAIYYMSFAFVNFGGDGEASRFYGWDQIGHRMQVLAAEQGAASTIAGYNYGTISKIGFAIGSSDVVSLSPLRDEFDYWRDEAALAGRDIVFIDEYGSGPGPYEPYFESVELLENFEISLFDVPLRTHGVYIGRSYRPAS